MASRLGRPILPEEIGQFGLKHGPCRLVRQEHVVLALERHEARVRHRGGQPAAFLERHAHVAAAMRYQGRDAQLRREVQHVDALHMLKQLRGDVGACGLRVRDRPTSDAVRVLPSGMNRLVKNR